VILRVVIIAVLLLLVARAVRLLIGGIAQGAGVTPRRREPPAPTRLVRDPVCGTHVMPRRELSLTSGGTTHYFCSPECRDRFERPEVTARIPRK
jgi:YHS domain-containing protein